MMSAQIALFFALIAILGGLGAFAFVLGLKSCD